MATRSDAGESKGGSREEEKQVCVYLGYPIQVWGFAVGRCVRVLDGGRKEECPA